MLHHRFERIALLSALFGLASLSLAACGGGGATTGSGGIVPPSITGSGSGSGSGSGNGSGSGSGSGTATASPSAGATATATATGGAGTGGGGTAAPTSTPSTAPTTSGGGTSAPTASPSATPPVTSSTSTPNSLNSIDVLPPVIDGTLGGVAQIGILDPNYTGAYSVSVTGGGLLGNILNTLSNAVNGTLAGSPAGTTTLTLNLADAVQLGVLGPNGNVVTICEQQNPSTCKSVNITNNGVVPVVGSSLASIVFGPSGTQTLNLLGPLLNLSNFKVTAAPQGITVTNLGNGQYSVSAAANIAVPLTGSVTLSDGMGHTITIPVAVL